MTTGPQPTGPPGPTGPPTTQRHPGDRPIGIHPAPGPALDWQWGTKQGTYTAWAAGRRYAIRHGADGWWYPTVDGQQFVGRNGETAYGRKDLAQQACSDHLRDNPLGQSS